MPGNSHDAFDTSSRRSRMPRRITIGVNRADAGAVAGYYTIKAPFDGIVEMSVHVGDMFLQQCDYRHADHGG